MNSSPVLVEPGVKYFLSETLKQCHELKEKYTNLIFNIMSVIFLVVTLGLFMNYRYKGKMNPQEVRQKELKKQHYILSKIRNYHSSKQANNITGMNEFHSGRDLLL